jgi:hypothetical protein
MTSNVNEAHLKYLSNLAEWGVTNMDAAAPYLQKEFPGLSLLEAQQVVAYWLSTKNQLLNEQHTH